MGHCSEDSSGWSPSSLLSSTFSVSIRWDGPLSYARSFFGVVDLLAILPTYLSLVFTGAQSLLVIRALRFLRVFRVLKLVRFVGEAAQLREALRASARKITIFIGAVLTVALIAGTVIYLIEGEESGFTSIPQAMYWAIVTMTTVGYGDVSPQTVWGKFLATVIMILGYGDHRRTHGNRKRRDARGFAYHQHAGLPELF